MTELMAIPIGRRPRCQSERCDRPATHAALTYTHPHWHRSRSYTAVCYLCSPHTGAHKRSDVLSGRWRDQPRHYVLLEVIAEIEVMVA